MRFINALRGGLRLSVQTAAGIAALSLIACSGAETVYHYPEKRGKRDTVYDDQKEETVFGDGGLEIFGGKSRRGQGENGGGIGVNSFLWRATLDTIAFMPLTSADPFGGVIITDWYSPPEAPRERFKMSVYILGRELRADGIRVSVFRQLNNGNGIWTASTVKETTATGLEDQILARARQLRFSSEKTK
jgi:hypothetical protein